MTSVRRQSAVAHRARQAACVVAVLCLAAIPGGPRHLVPAPADEQARAPMAASTVAPARGLTAAVSITGQLVGPDGNGLVGHVAAWRESDPSGARVEVDCDATGHFVLAGLAEDRWVVAASAPGFSEARAVRSVPLAAPLALRVVRAARVAGHVIGVDGQPAPAEVWIVGSAIWPARVTHADGSGAFAFENVPPGVYEVEARGATASAEPRRGLVVEEGGRAILTLALTPGRTLEGVVIDDATGAPIAGAEIVVAESALSSTPRVTRSDASGAFRVAGLRDGIDAIVTARADGRVALVAEPWTGNALTLRLARTGTVEGHVLDPDRRPIAGAQIEVWGEGEGGQPIAVSEGAAAFEAHLGASDPSRLEVTADVPPIPIDALGTSAIVDDLPAPIHLASYRTGADGSFRLEGVAPGRIEVIARHEGFATGASERVRVNGGETTAGVEVVLAPAGMLAGAVVDERGEGVADVRVEARGERDPWPVIAFTDARGHFEIAATGETVVRAVPFDRAPSELRVEVPSGARREATLSLDPAGLVLAGRVLDERGFPLEGAQLRIEALRPGTAILRTAFSASDGTFELASVPAPPLRVTVDRNGFAMGTSVDVSALDPLEIRLAPALRAVGAVSDAWTSEPVVGAHVLFVSEELPPVVRETSVQDDGTFSFPRLRAGTYAVRIEASGYVSYESSVTVRAHRSGEVELPPIALESGQRVEGDVVDRLGSVVERARVTLAGLPPVETDAQGHFSVAAVPAGDVTVAVAHESAGRAEVVRHLTRGRDDVSLVVHLPGRLDAAPTEITPARTRGVALTIDAAGNVTDVAHGSSAERAGIRPGDSVVAVDGIAGTAHLSGSGPALVTLTRHGETYRVRVERELR